MKFDHMIQIFFTVLVVLAIILTFVKVFRRPDKTTYAREGTFYGFLIGCLFGYYIISVLVTAPLGMLIGMEIGKKKKKEEH